MTIGTGEGGNAGVEELCEYSKSSVKATAWRQILADQGIQPRKTNGPACGGGNGGIPLTYLIGGAVAVFAVAYFLMPGVAGATKK
jgi:hypothetical protein